MTTAGAWVRNGDRWAVTARHDDGSLSVRSLTGRGRVTLPGDYVAKEVALAYALTLHKAQGVTVDRAVLVADEAISAEALYVGMTRGRHDNVALVVCDDLDDEHRAEPRPALEVLAGALGHVAAEQAALAVLRAELEASESLAVLVPRLANLESELRRNTPPDPAVGWAAWPTGACTSSGSPKPYGSWTRPPSPEVRTRRHEPARRTSRHRAAPKSREHRDGHGPRQERAAEGRKSPLAQPARRPPAWSTMRHSTRLPSAAA